MPSAFAQAAMNSSFMRLIDGRLFLPAHNIDAEIPLCNLGTLAEIGPDPRDVCDGFALAEGERTAYPSLWGHDADTVRYLAAVPNMYLRPLAEHLPGRSLRDYRVLWPRSGQVLVVQRVRLNTKRLMAVRMNQRVLSDVWWPIHLNEDFTHRDKLEKALVLWLNSTPGLFLLLGLREETEGAWVQFKKPMWRTMPVLNVRNLSATRREKLATAYDTICTKEIGFLPSIGTDSVRQEIDNAISEALSLPDLAPLRMALASEPILRQDMRGILV
jgi:hypothetical protein